MEPLEILDLTPECDDAPELQAWGFDDPHSFNFDKIVISISWTGKRRGLETWRGVVHLVLSLANKLCQTGTSKVGVEYRLLEDET